MRKLPPPDFDMSTLLNEIISEMRSHELKTQIHDDIEHILNSNELYKEKVEQGELFTIEPCSTDGNPIIFDYLSKNQYIKLYEYYFRSDKKKARKLYDRILISAHEKCPYCGGIGQPKNLDHYLPKSSFPQYSILPQNLIPACRDCNMGGKSTAYAEKYEDQILHPYFDDDKFFNEQWIFAQYTPGDPGVAEYYIEPPDSWEDQEKQRVNTHFNDFDIAKRYSIKAAEELSMLLPSMKEFLKIMSPNDYKDIILIPQIRNAPIINHWKRILFQALLEAKPFRSTE